MRAKRFSDLELTNCPWCEETLVRGDASRVELCTQLIAARLQFHSVWKRSRRANRSTERERERERCTTLSFCFFYSPFPWCDCFLVILVILDKKWV